MAHCITIPGGFACVGGPREKFIPCLYCSKRHTKLCDAKLPHGGTCDAPLCDEHSYSTIKGVDYCRDHQGGIAS
jgi:hypothetical protein